MSTSKTLKILFSGKNLIKTVRFLLVGGSAITYALWGIIWVNNMPQDMAAHNALSLLSNIGYVYITIQLVPLIFSDLAGNGAKGFFGDLLLSSLPLFVTYFFLWDNINIIFVVEYLKPIVFDIIVGTGFGYLKGYLTTQIKSPGFICSGKGKGGPKKPCALICTGFLLTKKLRQKNTKRFIFWYFYI